MSDIDGVLLSTAYLPNIQYFSKFILNDKIFIEAHENYQKQSFRNRSVILGANGPIDLVIPVIKTNGNHSKTCDILIDHNLNWQQVHWKTIVSAYRSSPFFGFFEQEFRDLFLIKEKFLLDYNLLLLNHLLSSACVEKNYSLTESFSDPANGICDFRNSIHPKARHQKPDGHFKPVPYTQVFSGRFGFIPNLSVVDLLFNEGPQAISICRQCIKK